MSERERERVSETAKKFSLHKISFSLSLPLNFFFIRRKVSDESEGKGKGKTNEGVNYKTLSIMFCF